jgi:penicillin-binding protein 2
VSSADAPRLRLSILAVVAIALFASLFARLYDLQIVGSPEFQVQAEANRVRTVQVEAPRGRVLDRNGKVIVGNRVAVVVAVDRNEYGDLDEDHQTMLVARLSQELTAAGQPITPEEIIDRLGDRRYSRYAPVPLVHDVPEQLKIYIEEHPEEFPAVEVERTAVREYPYGQLAAHILGYVGQINEDELTYLEALQREKPYTLNDHIGKSGVERTFEQYLRGTPGQRRIEVDANGDPVRIIEETPPRAGDDLVLAVDIDLQALAEQKVRQGLEQARARRQTGDYPNNGVTGSAVVLDPRTGEVFALASYPTFDPTAFVDGIDAGEWAYLNDPANHYPLYNWAIQGQWAPGSTYKLFTSYAGLKSGMRGIEQTYNDQGGYAIPGCTGAKCYRRNAGGAAHGNVDVRRALTVSSDAYYYSLGAQFWIERDAFGGETAMQQYLRPWGIGDETGIALTGERPGRVPDAPWKRSYCESIGCGDPVWRAGDSVNMAIGQGDVLVTPLQLANGYATLANGGTRYVPLIALRTRDARSGEATHTFEPEVGGTVDLPGDIRQAIVDGLAGVPRPGGTAAGAFSGFPMDSWPVAGKTGTAQVDGKADTALFSAFGPVTDPHYQVTVVLEESGFGGTAAAPVARSLFDVLSGTVPKPVAGPGGVLPDTGAPQQAGGSYD